MGTAFKPIRRHLAGLLLLTASLAGFDAATAAEDPAQGDIRNLRIGMRVDEIRQEDYRKVSCALASTDNSTTQVDLDGYERCPTDGRGLIPLRLHYAPIEPWSQISDRFDGTKISGHPVNLWIDIDRSGHLQGIRAETDAEASRYMRKKAFLLGLRVKARYGKENWSCERSEPNDQKQRVGGMFIDEICEKQLDGRRLILHTSLYRAAGQEIKEFVGATELEILGSGIQSVDPADRDAERRTASNSG